MFTKLELNKICLGLQKGNIPIKYSYITEVGANARAQSEENRKTCNGGVSYDGALLSNTIDLYISELQVQDEVTIFDFGSGVGNTVIPTIKILQEKGFNIHYHAFDISESIIELLKKNIQKHELNIKFDYTIIDFEEKDLSEIVFKTREKYNNTPVLGLFLGNTIGNFSSIERVLSNIMDSLDLKDKLVIGIERVDLENERWMTKMLAGYRTKNSHIHDFATLGSLGFEEEIGKFDVRFNKANFSVESFFVFEEDYSIAINGYKFQFQKGEKIKIFHSKKINEEQFSKLLTGLDLRICNLRTSKDNLYLQTLVENKRIY